MVNSALMMVKALVSLILVLESNEDEAQKKADVLKKVKELLPLPSNLSMLQPIEDALLSFLYDLTEAKLRSLGFLDHQKAS